MKILHLSDFHYKQDIKSQPDQDLIIDKLVKALNKEIEPFDFIFFTGDLVNDGISVDNFKIAHKKLIQKISNILKIGPDNIFLCAGNHALFRDQEMDAITSEFEKIKSIEQLDKFVENENDRQYRESLINIKNYINFQTSIYTNEKDTIKELYTIHKRDFNGIKISIVTINSAWRSKDSEKDRGNLFYPISFLKQITNEIKDCSFNFMLMHHNTSDFKEFVASEMEDLIFKNFHFLLSGHYHKQKSTINFTSDDGIFCTVAPAALMKSDHHNKLGYSIYEIDIDTYDVDIKCTFFNERSNEFDIFETQNGIIPTNKVKEEQNKLRRTLKKKYTKEYENANNLFVSNNETENNNDFITLFTDPILKTKSKSELASNKGKEEPSIPIAKIIGSNDSFFIFGKDKSGRTSLLYKCKLELIKKFNYYKQIPFYIDCKLYKNNTEEIDIAKLIRNYYEVSRNKIKELSNTYKLTILIDNYDPNDNFNDYILSFVKEYPTTRFIITCDVTIQSSFGTFAINGIGFNKLFIHEITRKEIRKITQKWTGIKQDRKEEVIGKIVEIFSQLNIPTNYWTVSLFLWIFEKTSDANFHNNFELIQLYIDGLLERKKLALDKTSKISYDDFKTYLGALAHYLLKDHNESNCNATYTDIVIFTEEYRKHRKRFVIQVEDILNLLINRGILKKDTYDRYSFRLNGVFEYFLAYHMTEDMSFKNEIIEDSHFYLSFGNELELYSGFNKRDKVYVKNIFEKTQGIFFKLNNEYNFHHTDKFLIDKIVEVFDITLPIHELSIQEDASLTPEQQDDLLEEISPTIINQNEVKKKRYYEEIKTTAENLERALFILSRVYRNSSINDEKLEDKILDFILNSACNLGFLLIDEIKVSEDDSLIDITDEPKEKQLVRLVMNFMPIVVETFLFDSLMQNNLERIINEKLQILLKDSKNNQFKIFILYFILIDLDVKNNKKYIDEIIDIAKLVIIKQSVLLKLYLYLMMKSHGNLEFEKFLKERIEIQSKNINSDADMNKISQEIQKRKRIAVLKKNSKKNK